MSSLCAFGTFSGHLEAVYQLFHDALLKIVASLLTRMQHLHPAARPTFNTSLVVALPEQPA